MKFQSVKLLFIFSCLYHQLPKRVFNFDEGNNTNDAELSSAKLENKPLDNLPESFIICSTHHQDKFNTPDTHTWYVLYRDEDFQIPWFSIGFWSYQRLWASLNNTYWYEVSHLPSTLIDDWITICVEIDTVQRTISTSIGGETFHKTENVKGLEERPKLNLRLGIVDIPDHGKLHQFHGKVAEISVFDAKNENITSISRNLCKYKTEKTIQKWENMTWIIKGNALVETIIPDSVICPNSSFISLRMPLKWSKGRGETVCNKFGKIFEFKSLKDIDNITLDHLFGKRHVDCADFWTPYLHNDGKVINQNNGQEIE